MVSALDIQYFNAIIKILFLAYTSSKLINARKTGAFIWGELSTFVNLSKNFIANKTEQFNNFYYIFIVLFYLDVDITYDSEYQHHITHSVYFPNEQSVYVEFFFLLSFALFPKNILFGLTIPIK